MQAVGQERETAKLSRRGRVGGAKCGKTNGGTPRGRRRWVPRVAIVACPFPVARRRRDRSPSGDDRRQPLADRPLLSRASAPTMRPLILTPAPLVSRGRRSNGKIFRLVKRSGLVPSPLKPRPPTPGPIRQPWGSENGLAHGRIDAKPGKPVRNQASRENLANLSDLAGVNHQCDHGPPGLVSQGSPQENDPLLAASRMRANQLAGWEPAIDHAEPSGLRRSAGRRTGWPCVSGGSGATCSFYSSRTGPWV